MARPSLVWFRKDLRLSDNPALSAALGRNGPIICLFVLDEESEGMLPVGGASAWWLHHSLSALAAAIANRGGRLILKRGLAKSIVPGMAQDLGAASVFWNRCYEPDAIARDTAIKSDLKAARIDTESFNGSLLREPWEVKTKTGGPFRVFSPFWRASVAMGAPLPALPMPERIPSGDGPDGDHLDDWALLPVSPDWAGGLRETWHPGESGARARLADFLDGAATRYDETRNRPDLDGTSRLSPHLAFGEISPREIWHIAMDRLRAGDSRDDKGVWAFLREIGWRDFNHNLLFHRRDLSRQNYDSRFDAFPWQADDAGLAAWQRGQTGYPLVDAGMRELWHTGFMHNRVRMVVASFLVKHLMIDWRSGEAWFRDTLVDADLANNVANWQWVAGCGADAAPYFRIFNPIGQGEKFDPDGAYIRRWVPEIAALPDKLLNKPWEAPALVLREAGVVLGETYPLPLVDHPTARTRALNAYEELKGAC